MQKIYILLSFVFSIHTETIYATEIKKNDTTLLVVKRIKNRAYPIIIQDSPARLFTMRQFNQNYLSAYRLFTNELNNVASKKVSVLLQTGMGILFFQPLTHEEGHRSILTSKGIGSISQPFFNAKGAAYVNGVKDNDLRNLKNDDLPTYIRLHTGGLESDYMLTNRVEKKILFGGDEKSNLNIEYLLRKFTIISYYSFSMIPALSPKLEEEEDELDRDIVGHDVYGAVRNLYKIDTSFYRYTTYKNLSNEEIEFVNRIGFRSFLNLLSPLLFKQLQILKKEQIKISVGAGYSMSPFGDFIDENIWIKYKDKYYIHTYFRQFQNKNTWFFGGGIQLVDYKINSKFKTTLSTHLWSQPEELDFYTSKSILGVSGDLLLKYVLLSTKKSNTLSIDLGMNYKTAGFLPEEIILDEHFGFRIGMTINLN
jgi:hypothetical protein